MDITKEKIEMSSINGFIYGNMETNPSRKPKIYMATANA